MAANTQKKRHMPYRKITIPKKQGLSWWRHIFTGAHCDDGTTRAFFIEYIAVNPALSPQQVIANKRDESFDDAVPVKMRRHEKTAANKTTSEPPSYILVRAGFFGTEGIIFEDFSPVLELSYKKTESTLMFKECSLGKSVISGSIEQNSVIYSLFSDSTRKDTFSWNLAFQDDTLLNARLRYTVFNWFCTSSKSLVNGTVQINKEIYRVSDEPAFGYTDKAHGKDVPENWFHASGVDLQSRITNKKLDASCFIVQGFSENKISVFITIESFRMTFKPSKLHGARQTSGCVQNEDKIHWTVSMQNNRYMLDIDIFCLIAEMKLLNYDSPAGDGVILSLLSGASGSGEIRLYKRLRKGLELIEHANIENVHCEYGGKDTLAG
jgi:hypothetical protein